MLGDGRLKFAEGSGRKFDLVLLDAFSSDSVPVHLLTKEAIRLYLTRVRSADSLIAINVTNRYLRFEAMLAAMAEELELKALIREDLEIEPALQAEGKARSRWVVFSASDTILNPLTELPGWRTLQRTKVRAWNDRYSSIVPLLSQR